MDKARIIKLPTYLDKRGNLSIVEQMKDIPFEIKRTYWLYDVPGGECRGGHAYKKNQEFIIAVSGSFDVILDDGVTKQKFTLNRSQYGLLIPPRYWREMENFSTNSLAMILSSTFYDAQDYIRDYDVFIKLKIDGQI